MPGLVGRSGRASGYLPGVARDDSDDELGTEDLPWEWIYEGEAADAEPALENARKRKRPATQQPQVVGARMGSFECYLGETMLLKAEGSNEAWVGIICDFQLDEDGDKAANFLWFSAPQEIRSPKKRTDFFENELYITATFDINPLTTINGKAHVMSEAAFRAKYLSGKVPRKSPEFGKVFICRRGCNVRTCTYTDEFVWEDVYRGREDIDTLQDLVRRGTKATRRRRPAKEESPELDYKQEAGGDDGDEDYGARGAPRTPKRPRTRDTAASTPGSRRKPGSKPATPSSHRRVMVKRHLEFTPLATRVLSPLHVQSSPYQLARTQLHVASVPTSLPCREAEFSLVYSHLEAAITDGSGTCIYISGTPGTGKTATVREVVARLDAAVRADELDDFIFVEINGMKITDPHQAYALLWEALKGQRVSPAQALDLLEREFGRPSPRRVPCVVLMDELDQLVTRNQGVMYNFFNWPGLRHSRLIVLAVANTMDLPERTLSNKISSRLGLTRITFPGYNHEQLMRIVQSRLEGVPGDIVDPDAVQFAARKVAAVSGDARRALDICRRAVELAEADAKGRAGEDGINDDEGDDDDAAAPAPDTPSKKRTTPGRKGSQQRQQTLETNDKTVNSPKRTKPTKRGRVTIETVRRAIAEATSSALQQYLRALPFASRLLLASLLARTRRSGVAESSFGDVLEELQRALRLATTASQGRSALSALRPMSGTTAGPSMMVVQEGSGTKTTTTATTTTTMMWRNGNSSSTYSGGGTPSEFVRPAGLGAAAVELAGAGIVHLEGHRAERPSKMRLAVGDEEVRLAFRDDPEIKAVGMAL